MAVYDGKKAVEPNRILVSVTRMIISTALTRIGATPTYMIGISIISCTL